MTKIGVVLGTGPSLNDSAATIRKLKGAITLFGVNRTFEDFDLDVLICCDPKFHAFYGKIKGDFDHWHWDKEICLRYGYPYIEGRWFDGLSTDQTWISLNHCSSAQALNLAVHYGCDEILLVGHDFHYPPGKPRHYFDNLSDVRGEYPAEIRKFSLFDKKGQGNDLLNVYKHIADQCKRGEIPQIYNCTPGSALPWFPLKELSEFFRPEDIQ